jgi:hypothetical protein
MDAFRGMIRQRLKQREIDADSDRHYTQRQAFGSEKTVGFGRPFRHLEMAAIKPRIAKRLAEVIPNGRIVMKISEFSSRLMLRLAHIPGLTFLQDYVISARGMKTRFGQRKGDYEAFIAAGRGAAGDIRDVSGKPRPQDVGDEEYEEDEIYEDDADYEDDYYDDDERSAATDGVDDSADDYPTSDEHITYYNDDYGSY